MYFRYVTGQYFLLYLRTLFWNFPFLELNHRIFFYKSIRTLILSSYLFTLVSGVAGGRGEPLAQATRDHPRAHLAMRTRFELYPEGVGCVFVGLFGVEMAGGLHNLRAADRRSRLLLRVRQGIGKE